MERNITFGLVSAASCLNVCWKSNYSTWKTWWWSPQIYLMLSSAAGIHSWSPLYLRHVQIVRITVLLLIQPRAGVSIETALCEADSTLTSVDASWDRRALCTPLFASVCYKSHPAAVKACVARRGEVRWCVFNSMRLCWLLLFFHDTTQCLSQSSSFRTRSTVNSWHPPWVCMCILYVCMCLICFLLPSHEYRDFSSRPWPWKIVLITELLNTSAVGKGEKEEGEQRAPVR